MLNLPVLGSENIQKIHEASLAILAETGIVISHPAGKMLLLEHGGQVDGDRILIPRDLVEGCLTRHPGTVRLEGRDSEKGVCLGDGGWYAHNVGGVPNLYDPESMTRRPATRADVAQAAQILDALPSVATITPHFGPQDVPPESITLWMTYETLANTTKPLRSPGVQTGREVRALAEMAQIAMPEGRVTVGISPISPLTFPDDIVDAILEVADQGLILGPLPCPIMGATAPMTAAGALAQQNAEVLATLVLGQLRNPGLEIIYKGRLSVMNPRSGLSVWGNPEIGLVSAATVKMGHFYNIPVDVYGLCTDAHSLGIQNGYERAFNALIPVLAGADEISGVGEMEGGVNSSLAQMVIDDEILASVRRIKRGFEVGADTLGLSLISEAMRGSRNFLAEAHTIQYLRSGEVLIPKLAERDGWAEWQKSGNPNMVERAAAKARQLLESHAVPLLSSDQTAAMQAVIGAFERQYGDGK